MPICGVYICVLLYVHNPERALKILRSRLKKGNGCLGKLVIERLQIRSTKGRTLDTHTTYIVNSYQGKVAGVCFFLGGGGGFVTKLP